MGGIKGMTPQERRFLACCCGVLGGGGNEGGGNFCMVVLSPELLVCIAGWPLGMDEVAFLVLE